MKFSLQYKHNFCLSFVSSVGWLCLSYQIMNNAISLKLLSTTTTAFSPLFKPWLVTQVSFFCLFVSKYRAPEIWKRGKLGFWFCFCFFSFFLFLRRGTCLANDRPQGKTARKVCCTAAVKSLKPVRSPRFSFLVAYIRN